MKSRYVIRLRRFGRSDLPIYYIVVTLRNYPSSSGKYAEKLGFMMSLKKSKYRYFFINFDRLGFWLLKDAEVSPKVSFLLGKLHYVLSGKR